MNNIPDRQGEWEWFREDGTKIIVFVYNIFSKFHNQTPFYRVYYRGGYYNVTDEWTHGTWGEYLGNSVDDDV